MNTAFEQSYIDMSVSGIVAQLTAGHVESAYLALEHLEGATLSEENKKSLYAAFAPEVPFDSDTDNGLGVNMADRLAALGVMLFITTDSHHWDEATCYKSAIMNAIIASEMPPVDQALLNHIDLEGVDGLTVSDAMTPKRAIVYENDSLHSWTLTDVDLSMLAFFEIERIDESTRVLKNVVFDFCLGSVVYPVQEMAECHHGPDHDRYDVTLTLGEPPKFTRLLELATS